MLQIPVVSFTASHLNAKRLTVSFQELFMFVFIFAPNASWTFIRLPRSPFTRRLGLVLKATNWQKACLLLSYNLFSLCLTRSAHTVSRLEFCHTEHRLLCPPFKRIKGISEPFRLRKYRIPCQPDMRPFLSLTL